MTPSFPNQFPMDLRSTFEEIARMQEQIAGSFRAGHDLVDHARSIAGEIARAQTQFAASFPVANDLTAGADFRSMAAEIARMQKEITASLPLATDLTAGADFRSVAAEIARMQREITASCHVVDEFTAGVNIRSLAAEIARLQEQIGAAYRVNEFRPTRSDIVAAFATLDETLTETKTTGLISDDRDAPDTARTVRRFEYVLRWFLTVEVAEALVGDLYERKGGEADARPVFVEIIILIWSLLISAVREPSNDDVA